MSPLLILMSVLAIHSTSAYKILIINVPIKSQLIIAAEMAAALAEHQHEVTLLIPEALSVPEGMLNPRIQLERYKSPDSTLNDDQSIQELMVKKATKQSLYDVYNFYTSIITSMHQFGEGLLADEYLYKRLAGRQFDLAIVAPPILYHQTLLAYRLGIPYAYLGLECIMSWMSMPSMSPNYVPNIFSTFSDRMSIFEKTVNTFSYIAYMLGYSLVGGKGRVEAFIHDRPIVSFSEIERNATICFRVRNSILDTARPQLPNVINVGNIMISRGNNPLPANIQTFLDDAVDGAVLVSFGSVIDKLPDEVIEKMAEAFQKTKYRIIWKSRQLPKIKLDDNKVLVLPWIPQVGVLMHSNTKAFVSHCGYSSSTEAVYYGVPVVGIPLFGDQDANAAMLQSKGFARYVNMATFTVEELTNAINDVSTGPEVDAIKKASAIMQDMPSDREKAVFWVEHVIKHGSKHLRSRVIDMSYFEYFMLDVAMVFLLLIVILLMFCRCCYACICYVCCKRNCRTKSKTD